ncbi:hypothetical protein [Holospora undulata]|uniref:Uncharacterized protein n=1 Tax=Holospora undulata HU1 TaxID=1321371 RepID=A0A061JFY1_9PROT|nr:hypothetical protein [Holospora undulata]ETZ04640.1 hypothetical protein K737_300960 [Holospora undulata HU1]
MLNEIVYKFNNVSYTKISERRRSCCVTNRRVEDRIKAILLSEWSVKLLEALLIDDRRGEGRSKVNGVKLGLCKQAEFFTNIRTYRTFGKPQRI